MTFYPRLLIAIILVAVLAEVAPRFVNMLLIIILAGLLLGRWPAFARLADTIGGLGGK